MHIRIFTNYFMLCLFQRSIFVALSNVSKSAITATEFAIED